MPKQPPEYRPVPDGPTAIDKEARIREQAAALLKARPQIVIASNHEEEVYAASAISNFTKGMPQDEHGIVDQADYENWVNALASPPEITGQPFAPAVNGDPYIFEIIEADNSGGFVVPKARKWESPLGGLNTDLVGPAISGLSLPPAPPLGSSELCAEMAEVYAMALLRDVSFEALQDGNTAVVIGDKSVSVQDILDELNKLSWFGAGKPVSFDPGSDKPRKLSDREHRRHSVHGRKLSPSDLFRGSTEGARTGPYLSQFLLQGTNGDQNGDIAFGTQAISQKHTPDALHLDYMTNWAEWLDVQRGPKRRAVNANIEPRFMTTPRDLAAYVHVDQLYQAYFNALLIMLSSGTAEFDQGLPQAKDDVREGFATWGGPHLLDLLARVSSPALRAVRRQKFQIHRRARPEVIAARITQQANGYGTVLGAAEPRIKSMVAELEQTKLLDWVAARNSHNETNTTPAMRGLREAPGIPKTLPEMKANYLLPMAFPEGSPMHPAYGAGHATVAGACTTVLKAFMRTLDDDGSKTPMSSIGLSGVVVGDGQHLKQLEGHPPSTISDELDKLAANISIGRNMAGVHFYTDYYESLRLGERVAVAMLQEHLLTSPEDVKMTFIDFDGRMVEISSTVTADTKRKGEVNATTGLTIKLAGGGTMHEDAWWADGL